MVREYIKAVQNHAKVDNGNMDRLEDIKRGNGKLGYMKDLGSDPEAIRVSQKFHHSIVNDILKMADSTLLRALGPNTYLGKGSTEAANLDQRRFVAKRNLLNAFMKRFNEL